MLHGQRHVGESFFPSIDCMCILGGFAGRRPAVREMRNLVIVPQFRLSCFRILESLCCLAWYCSLREYTYSQWMERNSHLHGVDHATSQALKRLNIQKQITEAYSNVSSIPGDEQTFTFSLSLMERLLQPTANLNAWLLQYQAGQQRLSNILKQERRNRGTITKFLISRTAGRRPAKPPD